MTEIATLLAKYRNKGILIDTNIFLLYLVGSVNRERIAKFKRTRQFIPEDYDLLLHIVNGFQKVVTTPNIMTEVNSLANQLGEPERSQCLKIFALLISQISEEYLDSISVAKNENFTRFGLTDYRLTELMIEHNVEVTPIAKYEVKKINSDYFIED